jgi:hypothetical protein
MKRNGMPTRWIIHWQVAAAVLTLSFLVCPFVRASERTPQEARRTSAKQTTSPQAPVFRESEGHLIMGYHVGRGKTLVTVRGQEEGGDVTYRFEVVPDSDSVSQAPKGRVVIKPERFLRMWGTREGMGAMARTLAGMLEDVHLEIRRINPPMDPIPTRIDGVALFEEDDVLHLLSVRIEGDEVVVEDIVVVAAGCTAFPPGSGGSCSCNGDGDGAQCSSGTSGIPGGTNSWAKCKDGSGLPSPEVTECTYNGSACNCQVSTAAQ